jgi:hypothetical protein
VRVVDTAVRISMQGLAVLLLLVALDAAAQGFNEGPVAGSMPSLALGLSSAGVRALNEEFDDDLRNLNTFSFSLGGGRRADQSTAGSFERPKPWMVYGRLGVFNFQNELEPSRSDGARITFRRTGPKLTGRYYIGIHRTF